MAIACAWQEDEDDAHDADDDNLTRLVILPLMRPRTLLSADAEGKVAADE